MIPFLIFLAVFGLNFRLIGDEAAHLHVISGMYDQWPRPDIVNYFAPGPPLPFLMYTLWARLVGLDPWKLRLIPVVMAWVSVNLFYDLARERKVPYPVLISLAVLLFPYVFFHAFTFYMDIPALCFGMAALRFYLRKEPGRGDYIWGGIFSAMAVYCRQTYFAIPAGLFLWEVWNLRPFSWDTIRARLPMILSLSIPVLAFLPIVLLWGGYTPPGHQAQNALIFVPSSLNYLPIFVAFYFFPLIDPPRTWRTLRSKYPLWVAWLLLAIFYFAFTPVFSAVSNDFTVTGLAMRTIDLFREFVRPVVGDIVQFVLWLVGVLILSRELSERPLEPLHQKVLAMLLVFTVLISITPFTTDRYFLQNVPLLTLFLYHRFDRKGWLQIWVVALGLLSIIFSVWQIGFKSFEGWAFR